MLKNYILCSLLLPALFDAPQAPPSIGGAVSKPTLLDAKTVKGLDRHKRMIKVANLEGNFICSLEISGYALKDVLDRCGIKKEDDGFDRPLDMIITAKGRNGGRALFSYGEVFLTNDEGPLLADSARMILPTHHGPLNAGKNDPTIMLDIKKRDAISLQSCISCHHGPPPESLHFPKGWLLVAANDWFPGRYIEELTEIKVAQASVKVEAPPRGSSRDMLVESPTIIGPDGKVHTFALEDYQKFPKQTVADVGIGIGRGYCGVSVWEGAPLKEVLRFLLVDCSIDPRDTYVLVTGGDGYRASFSGSEVFNNSADKCVLLIDRKDGQALGKGSGAFTAIQRTDFFVDRNVRMVKEIRLIVVNK
jgi:DMSO/TMAO reductase YedYZ molybdopterin-dependent catalytic subunit